MISFAYFDVGGVAINDFSGNDNWQKLQQELGIQPSDNEAFHKLWAQYNLELCLDRDVDSLVPIIAERFNLSLPESYSLLQSVVNLFYPNEAIWPVVKYMHERVGVGLLTNMYPGMFAAIERRHILPDVTWGVVVDSSLELLQKPDQRFFAIAAERAGVPPHEILFIDNSREHTESAQALGWQTFLYDPANSLASAKQLLHWVQAQEFRSATSEQPATAPADL